ncbi:MAG: nucleotide-binding protein [Chloroflexi bacterium]|nr:nucleotide-binding protein [Chloroflexota bacterium]
MSSELAAAARKLLVLDANILIRAVLGRRVLSLLEAYVSRVHFLAPEVAYAEASTHLPAILASRALPQERVATLLEQGVLPRLPMLVTPVPHEAYADLEPEARRRLQRRDEADWPIVALALLLDSPVWTEDQDLFGTGVPTWTTDRIEIYLASREGM